MDAQHNWQRQLCSLTPHPNTLAPFHHLSPLQNKLHQSKFISIFVGKDSALLERYWWTLLNSGIALLGCESNSSG